MAFDFHPVNKKVINNLLVDSFLEEVKNFAVENGWELWASNLETTYPYIVLRNYGYNQAKYEWPLYLCFRKYSNTLRVMHFFYFDNITNTPYGERGYQYFTYSLSSYGNRQGLSLASTNHLTMYANKDLLYLHNYAASTSELIGLYTYKVNDLPYNMTSQAKLDIPAGYDVQISLNGGDSAKYLVGDQYIMVNTDGTANQIDINDIDYNNDIITVDRIHYPTTSGAMIGSMNNIVPWASSTAGSSTSYTYKHEDLDIHERPSALYLYNSTYITYELDTLGPYHSEHMHGKREVLYRPYISTTGRSVGFCDYIRYNTNVAEGKTFGYNRLYSGTCTVSGTTNTLTDNTKDWDIDELSEKCLIVLEGTNVGNMKRITSNNSDTVTISGTFSNPTDESVYGIFEEGYISLYPNGGFSHLLRMI